jgi:serine/threonine protein kinase
LREKPATSLPFYPRGARAARDIDFWGKLRTGLSDERRMSVDSDSPDLLSQELGAVLAGTPYRPLSRLGRGGMGDVYVVEHHGLRRQFVLKVLRARLAHDPQLVDRMRMEAQAAARLDHPNIVEVIDFWSADGGRPCMVMEFLRGVTLASELRARGALSIDEGWAHGRDLLSALAAAHELGIVHRDIKPENLFLHEQTGERRVLKVLDFGLARVLPRSPEFVQPLALPTGTGTIVGTPRFMSPEAARGQRVDHRADIYSAGLVLYVMLTGRGPFDHAEPNDTFSLVPDPPSLHAASTLPAMLDEAILTSLKSNPDERFQNAAAFARALEASLGFPYGGAP